MDLDAMSKNHLFEILSETIILQLSSQPQDEPYLYNAIKEHTIVVFDTLEFGVKQVPNYSLRRETNKFFAHLCGCSVGTT